MATTSTTISDLSGEANAETMRFAVEGEKLAIDVTAQEKADFMKLISNFVKKARKDTAKKVALETNAKQRNFIRRWALTSGFVIEKRGRIPNEVTRAFFEEMLELNMDFIEDYVKQHSDAELAGKDAVLFVAGHISPNMWYRYTRNRDDLQRLHENAGNKKFVKEYLKGDELASNFTD